MSDILHIDREFLRNPLGRVACNRLPGVHRGQSAWLRPRRPGSPTPSRSAPGVAQWPDAGVAESPDRMIFEARHSSDSL